MQNALKVITQEQKDEGEKYMTYAIYFENIETIIRKYFEYIHTECLTSIFV